jgi:hypothetical protein
MPIARVMIRNKDATLPSWWDFPWTTSPASSFTNLIQTKGTGDKTTGDKTTGDKAMADKTTADKAMADKTTADKAMADKAMPDKAMPDKAMPDKAMADKTTQIKLIRKDPSRLLTFLTSSQTKTILDSIQLRQKIHTIIREVISSISLHPMDYDWIHRYGSCDYVKFCLSQLLNDYWPIFIRILIASRFDGCLVYGSRIPKIIQFSCALQHFYPDLPCYNYDMLIFWHVEFRHTFV